jgi:predicted transcriptional regulator
MERALPNLLKPGFPNRRDSGSTLQTQCYPLTMIDGEGQMHELLRASHLVPEAQELVSVEVGTSIRDAIAVLVASDFDQIPVTANGRVFGVFSFRSLSMSLKNVRKNDDPLDQLVEDCVDEPVYVRAGDSVSQVLISVESVSAVLLGDEESIWGVVTPNDVSRHLWRLAQPFVMIQDIELAVRSLMHRCCPGEEDRLAAFANALKGVEGDVDRRWSDLTFGDLINVLSNRKNYSSTFSRAFGNNFSLAFSLLDPVREIRNKVVHFRDEVSEEEVEIMEHASRFLRRKLTLLKVAAS